MKIKPVAIGITAGVLVIFDEALKFLALSRLPEDGSLIGNQLFALGLHKNYGIAFNIPLNLLFVIVITLVLILLFGTIIIKTYRTQPRVASGCLLILAGAMGNLFDRIVYGFTVDYLIFFTRSAINISDLVIIAGIGWLILGNRTTKNPEIHKS